MKVVSARTLKKEKKTAQAGREKDVLAASSECQNIIDLYSTFYDQQMETLNFVMPFIPNGNLQVILKFTGSNLSQATSDHIMFQLLQAVNFLHQKSILHRDLKPENMLFTDNYQMKLCDLGTAINTSQEPPSTFLGSAYYVSPEVMTTKIATVASDYWAIGCILYEMLMGGKMFKGRSEYYIMQSISKSVFNDMPEDLPYRDVILQLCDHDQETRTRGFQELNKSLSPETYKLNLGTDGQQPFQIKAHSPFGTISPEFVYKSFREILNVESLEADETDEIEKFQDDINFVDEASYRQNIEPPKGSQYFGEKISEFFDGRNLEKLRNQKVGRDEAIRDILKKQHIHNKWSSFLKEDELILVQGELFTRHGYERSVLSQSKDPPAEPEMFMVILKTDSKEKFIYGIIEDKLKYKISLSNCEFRLQILNNKIFTLLKSYPDRTWYFEVSNDDDGIDEENGKYFSNPISAEELEESKISSELWKKCIEFDI